METEKAISFTNKHYAITELLEYKIKKTYERFGLWFLTENVNKNNLITNDMWFLQTKNKN